MGEIIVLRGLQCSGKTTFAKKWASETSDRVRISKDDIRKMSGKYWQPKREPYVSLVEDRIFEEALERNYDVVIDDMNLAQKYVEHIVFTAMIHHRGAEVRIMDFFHVPLNELLRRNEERNKTLPEDERIPNEVIQSTFDKYKRIYNLKEK